MKKITNVLSATFLIFSLASCELFESVDVQLPSDSEEEIKDLSPQEEIYQLAKSNGYNGSYEQWLNSIKGDTVELALIDGYIQWKYTTSSSWNKLLNVEELKGEVGKDGVDGKTPEFKVSNGYLMWKYTSDDNSKWIPLILMSGSSSTDTITITFNPNNGEQPFTQEIIPGYNIARPEGIEYKGYILDGWYYEDTNDEWKFDYYSTSKEITLNAKWDKDWNYIPDIEDIFGDIDSSLAEYVSEVETVEINVWAPAEEEEVIETVVADWNKEHEAAQQFKVKFTAVYEGDCGTTLLRDPYVEGAPALFLCADDHLSPLYINNTIEEVQGPVVKRIINNNNELSAKGVISYDGKVLGYPITTDNGYFMWYNKSLVNIETVSSLEDLLAYAKSLGKSVLMDVPNGWYASSFIMSPQACGTQSLQWKVNEKGMIFYETNWDSEVGVKVSEYIQELLTPYYADRTLIIGSNGEIMNGFSDGSLIAAVSGTWMERDLKLIIGEDNLAACKLPEYHIDGKAYQMASFGGSKVYCVNETRPEAEQKTAAALAELLTTTTSQITRHEIRETLPSDMLAYNYLLQAEKMSLGGKALFEQNQYAAVQAKSTQGSYWDIGMSIGRAYLDPINLGGETWAEFLKGQMDYLRNPKY